MSSSSVALLAAALAACGAPTRDRGGGADAGAALDASVDAAPDCSDLAKLVYVFDEGGSLSSFYPPTRTFTTLGHIDCPRTNLAALPESMAVDRKAIAWVEYDDGELFRVDLASLACTATAWDPHSFGPFGMGFSTASATDPTDTLYLGLDGSLAWLDVTTLAVTMIGPVFGRAELSGTGDGQLWAFSPGQLHDPMPYVARLDKTTAAAATTFQLGQLASSVEAYAVAAWGGDLWVFLQAVPDPASIVHHVSGQNGALLDHTDAGGRRIVGAGVSTCAPVVLE